MRRGKLVLGIILLAGASIGFVVAAVLGPPLLAVPRDIDLEPFCALYLLLFALVFIIGFYITFREMKD